MKIRRLLLILMSVVFVAAIIAVFASRSSRHQTLSGYIEKLRANGEKMTFGEMIASLTVHTNNSLAILTNVVLQLGAPPADATNIDVMHFVGPGRAQVAWRLREPTWAASAVPVAVWADVGERIVRMAAPLAELRLAMQQPAPNAGFRTSYFESPTPYIAVKNAAIWLASKALWDLHENRPAEALASIQAIAGLADLHREESSLVSQMTRAASADLGLRLTWEALQTSAWDDEQLQLLQQCWVAFDFLEMAEKGLEGERCMGRETVKKMQDDPATKERFSKSYYGTNFLDDDLLFQLRHIQGYVEQTRTLRSSRSWREVSDSLDQLNAQMHALTNSPQQRLRYMMTLISTPNYKRAVLKSVQLETQRHLAITAIALKRYKHKHGQFPPSLDGLVPNFLPAVPRDCMNGQLLHYQFKDKDTFILYSVGEDGKDDDGDSGPAKPNGKAGFWEGRDAVWPLPSN
jgi:hypothetical protein